MRALRLLRYSTIWMTVLYHITLLKNDLMDAIPPSEPFCEEGISALARLFLLLAGDLLDVMEDNGPSVFLFVAVTTCV